MNKNINCYECIHHHVCKYFGNWEKPFPYKNDSYIKGYLHGLVKVLAEACTFFETKVLEKQNEK